MMEDLSQTTSDPAYHDTLEMAIERKAKGEKVQSNR
jgi:hypothetical protein